MTRTGTRTLRWAAVGTLAAGLLAACGQHPSATAGPSEPGTATGTSTASSTSSGPATAMSTPPVTPTSAADLPPFAAVSVAQTAEPSAGSSLTVSDVTVGSHEDYDRVVLTLSGAGAPGWRVAYVDAPVDDPSGRPLDMAGSAYLQVLIDGTGYPYDTGVTEWAGSPLRPSGLAQVREVDLRGVFEGQTQAFVGLDHQAPYRVLALTDPTRLVIDVQH